MTESLLTDNNIDLIIFDCDGVLIDSEILSKRVLLNMLAKLGARVSDDYYYSHFLGYNFEHVTAKVLADFNVTLTSEFRQNYRQALIQVYASELEPTTDLRWLLSQLKVNTCVATSSSPEKVKHSLHYTELANYFSGRVFTSSEVKHGKPAPDLFLHAAAKMQVAPKNCLVIEDSQAGIQAAQAANMRVIRYVGASHMNNRNIVSQFQDGVITIEHWQQLIELTPSITAKQFGNNSSDKNKK
jgi:HAD superfamily hydrolase (TIGR01509 family)